MVITKKIGLQTKGHGDMVDITPMVAREVAGSGVKDGTVTIFNSGSTAGVTTIEYEPGLIADFKDAWQRTVPTGIPYEHDNRWGDGNGYAHVRASMLGPSLVIPFVNKTLTIGTWQQIIVVDFDNRPRSRNVVLQIMGE